MNYDLKFDRSARMLAVEEHRLIDIVRPMLGGRRVVGWSAMSGGYRNTNLLIETDDGRFVARFSKGQRKAVQVEAALLQRLAEVIPVPEVMGVQLADGDDGVDVLLTHHVEGDRLCDVEDSLPPAEVDAIGTALGRTAASMHAVTFPEAGFLGTDPSVAAPFESYADAFLAHFRTCLSDDRCADRLGRDLHQSVARFMARHEEVVADLAPANRLVHSDFNTKNILVRRNDDTWHIAAILDWDFAHAGCSLTDLGNLFRFEDEQPGYRPAFTDAYAAAGGQLSPDWRRQARFLDLLAMLSFLAGPGERPTTFETARAVLTRTMDEWGN